jgi:hypothetical protein
MKYVAKFRFMQKVHKDSLGITRQVNANSTK